ncbi:MAG: hypothetical protein WCZ72_05880 [Gemmobacter sp.]
MDRRAKAERVAVLAQAAADLPEAARNGQLAALRAEMEALLRCLPGIGAGALAGEDAGEARFDNMPV